MRAIAARSTPKRNWRSRLHLGFVYGAGLAAACLLSFYAVTDLLSKVHSLSRTDEMLGGMWAVIATIFVYRGSYRESHRAALTRMSATILSFALCLVYLLFLPFQPWGLALLVGAGALVLTLLGRAGDIVICSITTAVVMVVAALSPRNAWEQPILRLSDTFVGIAVGLVAAWSTVRFGPPEAL